jgi:hypothetical protein
MASPIFNSCRTRCATKPSSYTARSTSCSSTAMTCASCLSSNARSGSRPSCRATGGISLTSRPLNRQQLNLDQSLFQLRSNATCVLRERAPDHAFLLQLASAYGESECRSLRLKAAKFCGVRVLEDARTCSILRSPFAPKPMASASLPARSAMPGIRRCCT